MTAPVSTSGQPRAMARRPRRRTVMIAADGHFPEADPAALEIFRRAVAHYKPHEVVLAGDFLDCGPFKTHQAKSFAEAKTQNYHASEVEPCRELVAECLRHCLRVVYLLGNHEARVEKAAVRLGSVLESIYPMISPEAVLSKGQPAGRFLVVPFFGTPRETSYLLQPDVLVTHGWSYGTYCARVHVEKARARSVIHGHTHREQTWVIRDPITDETHTGVSLPCLCTLSPKYLHGDPSGWSHGFGVAHLRRGKPAQIYTVQIQGGSAVLPDGTEVKA